MGKIEILFKYINIFNLMQCSLCDCHVVTNNTNAPFGVKYGTQKSDGKWYCTECSDVADFATEVTTVSEKKPVNTSVIQTSNAVHISSKATSVVHFYCSKCKDNATGSKCEKCGNPNPMYIRKKKW
jgi:hypothetical protein